MHPVRINSCNFYIHEISSELIKIQKNKIKGENIKWIKNFDKLKNSTCLFIANELGYELSLSDFAKDLALLTDYVLLPKSLKDQIQGLRDNDCHVLISEFFDDKGSVSDELISTLLKMANIEESPSETADLEMIDILLNDHGKLLTQMRKTVEFADKGGDEGTIDLLGAYIRELEKTSWMLDSWRMTKSGTHKKS